MQRINREFCLTDNSVNCYGYRLLTEGLELDKYKPPIGFLMHEREKGVAVTWTDFRVEGNSLFATPIVNDTVFPDLAKQIEEGFICAASVGHIVALEVSEDPADMLPGQTGPTVKRWFPREISIVDIPGNYNALARLYDINDNVLHDLSAPPKPQKTKPQSMELTDIFPELKGDPTVDDFRNFLKKLRDDKEQAERQLSEATAALESLRAQVTQSTIDALLRSAQEAHQIPPR